MSTETVIASCFKKCDDIASLVLVGLLCSRAQIFALLLILPSRKFHHINCCQPCPVHMSCWLINSGFQPH